MVSFTGHFDGKVIKPDQNVEIPVNTPLRITIESAAEHKNSEVQWDDLLKLANDFTIEGPEDLAEMHDKYAHGKRTFLRSNAQ